MDKYIISGRVKNRNEKGLFACSTVEIPKEKWSLLQLLLKLIRSGSNLGLLTALMRHHSS